MNITNRVEKVDKKMGSFVWFSCFVPELWSCADFSKKPKTVKEFTYCI